MSAWTAAGQRVAIFSSGSREAQVDTEGRKIRRMIAMPREAFDWNSGCQSESGHSGCREEEEKRSKRERERERETESGQAFDPVERQKQTERDGQGERGRECLTERRRRESGNPWQGEPISNV